MNDWSWIQWDRVKWWLCRWDMLEIFPFMIACIGWLVGRAHRYYEQGYLKGKLENTNDIR